MIKTLYKTFQHWSDNGSVYILSDTHFEDDDCKKMDKNWPSPSKQTELINEKAHKTDTLILLGDVGNVDFVKKIKAGKKILIMGNHDKGINNYLRKRETRTVHKKDFMYLYEKLGFDEEIQKIDDQLETLKNNGSDWENVGKLTAQRILTVYKKEQQAFRKKIAAELENQTGLTVDKMIADGEGGWTVTLDNHLFDEVYEGPLFISEKILLSHEPVNGLPWCLNIHGHDHNCKNKGDTAHINLAANVCSYTPVNLGKLIKDGCLSSIESIHRKTIDTATKRRRK